MLQELDELELLQTPERRNPRQVTAQDLSSMRVLNAIVHESLRLFSPALVVNKLLTEDVEVRILALRVQSICSWCSVAVVACM